MESLTVSFELVSRGVGTNPIGRRKRVGSLSERVTVNWMPGL